MRGTTSNCRKPTQFERNSAFFLIYWDDTEKLFLLLFESGFDDPMNMENENIQNSLNKLSSTLAVTHVVRFGDNGH